MSYIIITSSLIQAKVQALVKSEVKKRISWLAELFVFNP